MKRFAISCFLCFIVNVSFSQRTEKTYYPAYIDNKQLAAKFASEQQLHKKSIQIEILLLDYPILENLNEFSKKERYSIINSELVLSIEETTKFKVFILTNKIIYKVRKSKLVTDYKN
jgi:hypothetical protein